MRPSLFLVAGLLAVSCLGACSSPQALSEFPDQTLIADEREPLVETASQVPPLTRLPTQAVPTLAFFTEKQIPTATTEIPNQENALRCGILLPVSPQTVKVRETPFEFVIPEHLIPEGALPALVRLRDVPGSVGLAAFEVGHEDQGVYLNSDMPMPLASVVKIINLVAFAEATDQGILDPNQWVPLETLDQYYLPGSDRGAHERALDDLAVRGLIGRDPPSIPLEEIPWMMMRHSSNAAADYIHLALGQATIEETAQKLDLTQQTAPCPWIGQFLIMNSHETPTNNNQDYVQSLIDDPNDYGIEVMRLTEAFTSDPAFRQRELDNRWRSNLATQRLFSNTLNAHGSPIEYASLMSKIMSNNIGSDYVNIIVRRALEWPTDFETNQEYFSFVGYKNGSLPGVLTTAYYAQRLADGAQLVVILFYRDLPGDTYQSWRQALPHDELARWLLIEPRAIPLLRQLLS